MPPSLSPPTRRSHRRSTSPSSPAIIGLALFASATPSPLYADYAASWHFSTPVLTAVYAVYALGVLTTLLLIGRLSDEIGRRPVLLGALSRCWSRRCCSCSPHSVVWLFAARGLQGLATGAALGAAGAAMLDLHPRGDAVQAGLVNGVGSALGIGLGAGVSSVLVQEAPDPRVTPFVLLFVLFAIALAGTLALREPVDARRAPAAARRSARRCRASVRPAFLLASLGVIASWSIGGLYLSLGAVARRPSCSTPTATSPAAPRCSRSPARAALAQLAFRRLAPRVADGRRARSCSRSAWPRPWRRCRPTRCALPRRARW